MPIVVFRHYSLEDFILLAHPAQLGHVADTLRLDPYDYCIERELKPGQLHPQVVDKIQRHGFWHGDHDPGPNRRQVA
jgi:BarA-like signal transduction histidine kinase